METLFSGYAFFKLANLFRFFGFLYALTDFRFLWLFRFRSEDFIRRSGDVFQVLFQYELVGGERSGAFSESRVVLFVAMVAQNAHVREFLVSYALVMLVVHAWPLIASATLATEIARNYFVPAKPPFFGVQIFVIVH